MTATTVTEQYTSSPDAAWLLLGNFAGLADYTPGVEDVVLGDDTRTFTLLGMRITERLVARDDPSRTLTYAITDGVPGVESHEATIRVAPHAQGCEVSWSVTTDPEAAAPLFADAYRHALDGLHATLDTP
ncbi:MAG TPA: SRPBCC family protein [Acidimicrobiales bacterium]